MEVVSPLGQQLLWPTRIIEVDGERSFANRMGWQQVKPGSAERTIHKANGVTGWIESGRSVSQAGDWRRSPHTVSQRAGSEG